MPRDSDEQVDPGCDTCAAAAVLTASACAAGLIPERWVAFIDPVKALRLSSSIMMTSLLDNVRYGLRQIRRSPEFSAIEPREALRAE